MRRLLPVLLGATLLLAGCGDDSDGDRERAAATSIPDDTTSSTTTTEPPVPPPDVIPTDVSLITEEYVEQVLDALFEVDLEAVALASAESVVDQPAIDRLEAINSEAVVVERINDLLALAADDFPGMLEPPGALTVDVLELLQVTTECVFAEVRTDASAMFPNSYVPSGAREFLRLLPATQEQRRSGLNPTAWVMDQLPVTLDGSLPDVGCPA